MPTSVPVVSGPTAIAPDGILAGHTVVGEHLVWKMRWGDSVLACGAGEIPFELRAAPRPRRGDRSLVRWGELTYELESRPIPPPVFIWGVPDLHFVKVLVMCLMVFSALVMVLRERIAELQLQRLDHTALFIEPEPARVVVGRFSGWNDRSAWRNTGGGSPIAARELARIQRFPQKVKDLSRRSELEMNSGLLKILGASSGSNVFGGVLGSTPGYRLNSLIGRTPDRVERKIFDSLDSSGVALSAFADLSNGEEGGVVGGVVGGVGVAGGSVGLGGLGRRGRDGEVSGVGGGQGYGRGGLGTLVDVTDSAQTETFQALHLIDMSTSDASAKRVLRRHTAEMRACVGEGFKGELDLSFQVQPDGSVATVNVNKGPDAAKGCITGVLEKLSFKHSETAQTMTARWNAG